jgi:hypothetical protein
MQNRTKHQEKIIRNYYQNRDAISLQRLQEIVTDLYLATGKKRAQHWKSLAGHLLKLGVKQDTIDHLIAQDKPELAASLVEKLLAKTS